MSRDYIKEHRKSPRQFLIILPAFLCGYLTAVMLNITSITTWIHDNIIASKKNIPAPSSNIKQNLVQNPLPKPKFEFYTLLSKDNSAPTVLHRDATLATHIKTTAKLEEEEPLPLVMSKSIPSQVGIPATKIQQIAPQTTIKMSDNESSLPVNSNNKETYLIQLASFNKRQDADHLKASLVLRGFDVTIMPIIQQNIPWFRVMIGPFHSRNEVLKAHVLIARNEHINGVIRKMN